MQYDYLRCRSSLTARRPLNAKVSCPMFGPFVWYNFCMVFQGFQEAIEGVVLITGIYFWYTCTFMHVLNVLKYMLLISKGMVQTGLVIDFCILSTFCHACKFNEKKYKYV